MRRMARVKWVDKDNMLACVEAGAIGVWRGRCGACASVVTMVCWTAGSVLAEQLRRRGVTLGHEPDSMEFSTLGGWIATRASGMKKNVYGNIEDIVVNCKLVTPTGAAPLFVHMRTLLASLLTFATACVCACTGTWERGFTAPRVSVGSDSMQLVLGSEGTLGIITEAVVRVRVRVLPWFSCARLSSSHATRAVVCSRCQACNHMVRSCSLHWRLESLPCVLSPLSVLHRRPSASLTTHNSCLGVP